MPQTRSLLVQMKALMALNQNSLRVNLLRLPTCALVTWRPMLISFDTYNHWTNLTLLLCKFKGERVVFRNGFFACRFHWLLAYVPSLALRRDLGVGA